MKTYDELTEPEKSLAIKKCLDKLLEQVISGVIRFNDVLNEDNLQAMIDFALQKAEQNCTPWFAAEFIAENIQLMEILRGMAECDAEDSFYSEPGEYVISGIVQHKPKEVLT